MTLHVSGRSWKRIGVGKTLCLGTLDLSLYFSKVTHIWKVSHSLTYEAEIAIQDSVLLVFIAPSEGRRLPHL
jgi:hypothetical protein